MVSMGCPDRMSLCQMADPPVPRATSDDDWLDSFTDELDESFNVGDRSDSEHTEGIEVAAAEGKDATEEEPKPTENAQESQDSVSC